VIFETYSERLRKANRAGQPDVYQYDDPPAFMRRQIALALQEGIGDYDVVHYEVPEANQFWEFINRVCDKEVEGYARIAPNRAINVRIMSAVEMIQPTSAFLDVLEVCARVMLIFGAKSPKDERGAASTPQEVIDEINGRLRQHGFGYQIENGTLIRVDSQFAHAEIIKPTLSLLTAPQYSKASDDFLIAHQHYRAGNYKDSVTAANRAFESAMKAICDQEGWVYQKGDTAGRLIAVLSQRGLFTHDFDAGFTSYIAMLKTGLPAIRNDAGAHGEGLAAEAVTIQIARYAINMSATNILFLAESYTARRSNR
jgi:hypothetical protein